MDIPFFKLMLAAFGLHEIIDMSLSFRRGRKTRRISSRRRIVFLVLLTWPLFYPITLHAGAWLDGVLGADSKSDAILWVEGLDTPAGARLVLSSPPGLNEDSVRTSTFRALPHIEPPCELRLERPDGTIERYGLAEDRFGFRLQAWLDTHGVDKDIRALRVLSIGPELSKPDLRTQLVRLRETLEDWQRASGLERTDLGSDLRRHRWQSSTTETRPFTVTASGDPMARLQTPLRVWIGAFIVVALGGLAHFFVLDRGRRRRMTVANDEAPADGDDAHDDSDARPAP